MIYDKKKREMYKTSYIWIYDIINFFQFLRIIEIGIIEIILINDFGKYMNAGCFTYLIYCLTI